MIRRLLVSVSSLLAAAIAAVGDSAKAQAQLQPLVGLDRYIEQSMMAWRIPGRSRSAIS